MFDTLLKEKNSCCGCGACASICPKGALALKKDQYGFMYPYKDNDLCVDCNLCEKVCKFGSKCVDNSFKKDAYAVASKDSAQSELSSSGGFFAKLAEAVIINGGCVCGSAWDYSEGKVCVKHIIIYSVSDIKRLQGSKYVQSEMGDCYIRVREMLNEGRQVLFSGTPCQVDGLKGFLRRDYDNLLLLDIVCHGVPNADILNDYLKYNWPDSSVSAISFRYKRMGWGKTGYLKLNNKGKEKTCFITPKNSSYYSAFNEGTITRENCYECPYTGANRPADITIGDFWGVKDEHAEFVKTQNDAISAVILNSEKGIRAFEKIKDSLNYCQSDFTRIAKHNSQLRKPTIRPESRQSLLDAYAEKGYIAIEDEFCLSNSKISVFKESIKLIVKAHINGKL